MSEIIKCPFCGEEIKKNNSHHIKKCISQYIEKMSNDEIENLKKLYEVEEKSLVDISKIINLPYSTTKKILEGIGISLRNISEACKTSEKKKKYEQTMMEHFGTKHNFDKNCSSRKKWEERLLKEEGITNVFQRKDVIDKIHNTLIEKYGENWKYQRSKSSDINYFIKKYGEKKGVEVFNRICFEKGKANKKEYYIEKFGDIEGLKRWDEKLKKIGKGLKHNNGLNDLCDKILKENKIDFEREFYLKSDEKYYFYDFKIGNLLIELNGVYWHCSPKIYKPNDLVKFPYNKFVLAKDKWDADKKKIDFGKKMGYNVITIWEDEFSKEKVLEILKENNYGISQN